MYENEFPMSESEVASNLMALVEGEMIEDTTLEGSRTTTLAHGAFLTLDEGFVLFAPDGSKFMITVKSLNELD